MFARPSYGKACTATKLKSCSGGSRAENRASDANMRRPKCYGLFEIVAHSHRKARKAVAGGDLGRLARFRIDAFDTPGQGGIHAGSLSVITRYLRSAILGASRAKARATPRTFTALNLKFLGKHSVNYLTFNEKNPWQSGRVSEGRSVIRAMRARPPLPC